MKYPDYFEISNIEELKAFLLEDPRRKRSNFSGQKEKGFFMIAFKMTDQCGRMGMKYKCFKFHKDWDDKKIVKLMFKKVE